MIESQREVADGERFAFGRNWREFIELVDEKRINAAIDSLRKALGTADLTGRTFLDVGCGSGLFSLAANRMGARVRSFDLDPESVAATVELRDRFGASGEWIITHGSILDEETVAGLGRFDIVYSWGVLHHTGDLWRAVAITSGLVASGGRLYISIYNDQGAASRMWRRVKRRYNRSGALVRRLLVVGSAAYLSRRRPMAMLIGLVRGPGPVVWRPSPGRGMSTKHDMIDWVGGYPFEVAKPEQVFDFFRARGFELRRLKTCGGSLGCNEFVFQQAGGRGPGSAAE